MTAEQDKHTQEMNAWFEQSFNTHMSRHVETINEHLRSIEDSFDDTAAEVGAIADQQDKRILELLEIVKELAVGNAVVSRKIDQIVRTIDQSERLMKVREQTIYRGQ